jgi:Domain of unknown function (DUF4476)
MKKLITLFMATSILTSTFAQQENNRRDDDSRGENDEYNSRRNDNNRNGGNGNGIYNNMSSALLINGFAQNKYVVFVDNILQQQSNNSINIGSLSNGNHTIIINEIKTNIWGKERQEQIYNSVLFFKPSMETVLSIAYNGQVSIAERQLISNGNNNGNQGCGNGNNRNGNNGNGRKKYKHRRYNNNYPNQYPNNYPNNYPNQYPNGNQQISTIDFNSIKQYIQKESFDDRKLNIAKQAATNSYFSVVQVKKLMTLLAFDEGKLELAKYYYNRTIDKNNYYQLTDALTFGTNKDALLEYIKTAR